MGGETTEYDPGTGGAADQELRIRPYGDEDADAVIDLFARVNRALATPETRDAFETYIARSIEHEIGCIPAYYDKDARSSFWIAEQDGRLVGMFGLERLGEHSVELRRMYVAPEMRRRGFARRMLVRAEEIAAAMGYRRMELSTSELQDAALTLYRQSGFVGETEYVAEDQSHKTIGGGIRRFAFFKDLAG